MKKKIRKKHSLILYPLTLFVMLATGCSSISYPLHLAKGHYEVLYKSEAIDRVLKDSNITETLRHKLTLAKTARTFAILNLQLPENQSYTRYTNLGREAVVWNVVVASEFSLELETWCFPLAGCVSYKGFYSKKDAEFFAKKKQSELGVEAAVVEVPAYSTLGWSNWLGGDPLLNTFIYKSDIQVIGLIFHELAHQKVYVKDDSAFNESFATAVEREGIFEWLKKKEDYEFLVYEDELNQREYFNELLIQAGLELRGLYSKKINHNEMRSRKQKIMSTLRHKLLSLSYVEKLQKKQKNNFIRWVNSINNAHLGMIGLYEDLTPGFRALFKKNGNSWNKFYKEVEKIKKLPKNQRREILLKYTAEFL